MQIMADKGLLVRNTNQRSHVYTPALESEEVQSNILDHILKTVFRGSRSDLVMQALGHHEASHEELEKIRKFINNMEEK
jgi:predicted transcriptional regulator